MGRWQCCGREFDSEEDLVRHDVDVHGAAREAVGSCCGVKFYTRQGLEDHMQTAHGKTAAPQDPR